MNLLRSNEATRNFLDLQQQPAPPTVTFSVNDGATVDIKVGRDNQTLQVLPLINSYISALNEKRYNYTATNWTVNNTNSLTDLSNPFLGKADGWYIKDSFCLSSNIEGCYQNKTDNFYEFFLIKNSSTPDQLLGAGIADGVIGLAPGQNGVKSYPEYLKDRKIINSNTIGVSVTVNDKDKKTQRMVTLGAEKPATTGVNYVVKTLTSPKESFSGFFSSFQGLTINGARFKTANTSKSYL